MMVTPETKCVLSAATCDGNGEGPDVTAVVPSNRLQRTSMHLSYKS
jgi:hypothetical protein